MANITVEEQDVHARPSDDESGSGKDRMSSGTGLRVLTAVILIPIVAAAIWWGPTWLVAVLCAFCAVAALLEFFSIAARLGVQAYRLW
jgi:fatty acid desaturase